MNKDYVIEKLATRNKFINRILALNPGKTFEEIISKEKFDLASIFGNPYIKSISEAQSKSEWRTKDLAWRTKGAIHRPNRYPKRMDYNPITANEISDDYVYRGVAIRQDATGRPMRRSVIGGAAREGEEIYTSPQRSVAAEYMDGFRASRLFKINTNKISKVGPPTYHLADDYSGVIDMSREEAAKLRPKNPERIFGNGPDYERIIKPKDDIELIKATEEVLVVDKNGNLYPLKLKSPTDKALIVTTDRNLPAEIAKNRYYDPITKTFKNKLDEVYS